MGSKRRSRRRSRRRTRRISRRSFGTLTLTEEQRRRDDRVIKILTDRINMRSNRITPINNFLKKYPSKKLRKKPSKPTGYTPRKSPKSSKIFKYSGPPLIF